LHLPRVSTSYSSARALHLFPTRRSSDLPSLRTIFKELEADLGIPRPATGDLTGWARQGVLLLNAVLTVRAGQPRSHAGKGWEQRSEEHTSELQSRENLVCRLLLEKKNKY